MDRPNHRWGSATLLYSSDAVCKASDSTMLGEGSKFFLHLLQAWTKKQNEFVMGDSGQEEREWHDMTGTHSSEGNSNYCIARPQEAGKEGAKNAVLPHP